MLISFTWAVPFIQDVNLQAASRLDRFGDFFFDLRSMKSFQLLGIDPYHRHITEENTALENISKETFLRRRVNS
jgi:hypothetical protein